MGQILNKIFKMEYEVHAYETKFEIENVFKSEMKKIEINFEN